MHRNFFFASFLLGAAAVAWAGSAFLGSNTLALTVTMVIGATYALGALELHRFRQATTSLSNALSAIPQPLVNLGDWLATVHPSLQNPVRLRIEGERTGLPGPALTPYLVGLLVMLGMLGTFLGMVVTLNGAVFALEGTTDLQAIRSAFAAPIKGLGLAFGTSVAGVAASAMLGLMSAMSRRERMLAAQLLDTQIATRLRDFSYAHQRQEAFKALQLQAQTIPAVAQQMQAMMAHMERMSEQLNDRLLTNQENFHSHVKGVYTDLACAVDQSLRESLIQGAKAAGDSMRPVLQSAMADIAQDNKRIHERLVASMGQSLEGFNQSFEQRSTALARELGLAYATQQEQICSSLGQTAREISETAKANASQAAGEVSRLLASSEELVRVRMASEATWTQQHGERLDQLVGVLRNELTALRDAEASRANAAVERLGDLQTALASHLTTLGTALEDPIARLIETASQAPRAAAEVIGKLREEISNSTARDNALLQERAQILETLNTLLDSIRHASVEQRSAIDALVTTSATALREASGQFSETLVQEADKLADVAAQVTSSAVEVSSLSDTLSFAVGSFGDANEKLITHLQRIEGAMDKSMARSDEQLAYYVAQAREVIDLSILSQKEIFAELRQLPAKQALQTEEAL